MPALARMGAFTRDAQVLCCGCLKEYGAAPTEQCFHDAFTTCDGCGRRVSLPGRDDVALLANVRHAVNARIPGAARLQQTGGMLCAVRVDLPSGAYLLLHDDESSIGRTGLTRFADDDDDEGTPLVEHMTMDDAVQRVAFELAKAEIVADAAGGDIPDDVADLAELDDFLDGAGYGGGSVTTDVHGDFWERHRARVDAWLRSGGLQAALKV